MTMITPYQKAALNFSRHISLTANAGSGKTFVLSRRFVEIALNDGISLSSIVAITFTDKAASELYKKIAAEINDRLDRTGDNNEYKKLLKIRRQLVSAKISTIHSFCSELLREFSPEAGLDANFSLIDQTAANEIIEKEIFDYITGNLNGQYENEIKYLIRVVGSLNNLIGEFKSALIKIKVLRTVSESIYGKSNQEIVEIFNEKYEHLFNLLIKPEIETVISKVKQINSTVLESKPDNKIALEVVPLINKFDSIGDTYSLVSLLKQLGEQIFTANFKNLKKRGYLNKDADEFPEDETYLISFFTTLDYFSVDEHAEDNSFQLAEFGKTFIHHVLNVAGKYEETKRKFGYLDYEDLLYLAEKLVGNQSLREALSEKYKYIMIDEFQDTNEIQYNIFLPILNMLNSGNLFVVGDEKQSIYMFRDAELNVFARTKDMIGSIAGKEGILELPHSFRLSPKLALFSNTIFGNLFSDPVLEFNEVASSELISARSDTETGEIEFLLDETGEPNAEADLVAAKILELVRSRGIKFNDIAVLVRKRKSFDALEKVFINKTIPYKIVGGRGFYQQQVVYDVFSYLAFLTDRSNDSALIAILRSPFYTVADDQLYKISAKPGDTYYSKLQKSAIENEQLSEVVKLLDKHFNVSRKIELAELIGLILRETGYWAVVASRLNSKQDIANLNKILQLAKSYSRHSFKTLYDFVDFLKTSIARFEDEGQAQIPEEGNAVNLLTIHQSKGLEFEAVFLFNSHLSTQSEMIKSKAVTIDKNFGVIAKLPHNKNYFEDYSAAPVVGIYNYYVSRKNAAEIKRLLYVAMTRAVNNLYICGSVERKPAHNSFLSYIKEGLNQDETDDPVTINGELKLMLRNNEEFELTSKVLSLNVPVIKEPGNRTTGFIAEDKPEIENALIDTDQIKSSTKEEIISATKVNIYTQCPLKYHLTYNLGYTDLFKRFNLQDYTALSFSEDDELSAAADLEGRIIHSILEEETPVDELRDKISKNLSSENIVVNKNEKDKIEDEIEKINNKVIAYYQSETYKEIKQYADYRNEYEVYLKIENYYLYGIIDKFIISDNELIVIDYKTDSLSENKSKEKFEYYRNQLLFYSYVLSKHLNLDLPVKIQLVFIEKPELSVSAKLSINDLIDFESYLKSIIKRMRNNEYPKNYNHCSKCHFAINQKCVVK